MRRRLFPHAHKFLCMLLYLSAHYHDVISPKVPQLTVVKRHKDVDRRIGIFLSGYSSRAFTSRTGQPKLRVSPCIRFAHCCTATELFPIESDKTNKPYGWRWRKNNMLNIPGMDSSTALTFSLAKQMIQAQLPKSVLFKMQPYFQQAEQVLQELKGRKHSKWKKKIRILPRQLSLESPTIRPEISDALYDALLQETPIKIRYQKRNDSATTEYRLHPVGLVFQDKLTYLIANYRDDGQLQQFALHRIQSAEPMELPCKKFSDQALDDYIAKGSFDYPKSETLLSLEFRMEKGIAFHLLETPLSPGQQFLKELDGYLYFKAPMQNTQRLRWWLLGFGDQVEVLKPEKLRREIAAIAQQTAALYRTSS